MISKRIACPVRARIVLKTDRGRESVCTLRPKAVNAWALHSTIFPEEQLHRKGVQRGNAADARVLQLNTQARTVYRRFWEERFDKLDAMVNQRKKAEVQTDGKHGL